MIGCNHSKWKTSTIAYSGTINWTVNVWTYQIVLNSMNTINCVSVGHTHSKHNRQNNSIAKQLLIWGTAYCITLDKCYIVIMMESCSNSINIGLLELLLKLHPVQKGLPVISSYPRNRDHFMWRWLFSIWSLIICCSHRLTLLLINQSVVVVFFSSFGETFMYFCWQCHDE